MTDEHVKILKDTFLYGLVGTIASIPVMLWLVPKEQRGDIPGWYVPTVLTGVGLITKLITHYYLHADTHDELQAATVAAYEM
jgi:hypothetical protein